MQQGQHRLYEVDLYRCIAALMVVIFHYSFVGYSLNYAPAPRFDELGLYSRYLYLGINFFFLISGFVILLSASDAQPAAFIRSRVIRLYPAYWLAVLLTGGVTLALAQPQFPLRITDWLLNLTMLQSGFGVPQVESAYWTLWIELQFYAVVWLLCWRGWLRYLPQLCGLVLLCCLASLYGQDPLAFDVWTSAFPHWAGYFALGALFYRVRQQGLSWSLGLLLLLGVCFVARQNWLFAALMEQWYGVPFSRPVILTLNGLFLLLLAATAMGRRHPLRRAVFVGAGALTYPLYLIHQHLGYQLFNLLHERVAPMLLLVGTVVLMLLAAWGLHRYLEAPLALWLRRRWPATRPAVTADNSAAAAS